MRTPLKYLATYAEPESRQPISLPKVDSVAVVPCLGEDVSLLERSLTESAALNKKKLLIIYVVNNRLDHPPEWIEKNRMLISRSHSENILIIDRSTQNPFAPKQGVGLARKIGCDIALKLITEGVIQSQWIHCVDADCVVSEDYFSDEFIEKAGEGVSVGIYPFEHVLNWKKHSEAAALQFYDLSMRYYVEGLASAGSPYAYHSLGSTLLLNAEAYATVRGFPKTNAAEDFYLLNKLAKVGRVHPLKKKPVQISQRISSRVPFGTGVSIQKIASQVEQGEAFLVYNPESFTLLKQWLLQCKEFSLHRDREQVREHLCSLAREVLESMGALDALEVARKTRKTPEQIHRHLMDWFDAFRTLKFIHALRDRGLEKVPIHFSAEKWMGTFQIGRGVWV